MNSLIQLALDTSTSRPAVALLSGDKILSEWLGPDNLQHNETLLAGIDHCKTQAGIELSDISYLSVGIGPGMFTGLRIGITTAKFLADSLGIICVPISSLQALASQGPMTGRTWALSDAKSRRVYALCCASGSMTSSEEEVALTPEEVTAQMQAGDFLFGEGAALYANLWPQNTSLGTEHSLLASSVGKLGAIQYALGNTCSATDLLPKYLKTGQKHL